MVEILIKIKIEGNSNALAFVEPTQPYLSKTLKEIRQDIVPKENCCLKILRSCLQAGRVTLVLGLP